jgi:hypothetical protein
VYSDAELILAKAVGVVGGGGSDGATSCKSSWSEDVILTFTLIIY